MEGSFNKQTGIFFFEQLNPATFEPEIFCGFLVGVFFVQSKSERQKRMSLFKHHSQSSKKFVDFINFLSWPNIVK